jgi:hypothetical protein
MDVVEERKREFKRGLLWQDILAQNVKDQEVLTST